LSYRGRHWDYTTSPGPCQSAGAAGYIPCPYRL